MPAPSPASKDKAKAVPKDNEAASTLIAKKEMDELQADIDKLKKSYSNRGTLLQQLQRAFDLCLALAAAGAKFQPLNDAIDRVKKLKVDLFGATPLKDPSALPAAKQVSVRLEQNDRHIPVLKDGKTHEPIGERTVIAAHYSAWQRDQGLFVDKTTGDITAKEFNSATKDYQGPTPPKPITEEAYRARFENPNSGFKAYYDHLKPNQESNTTLDTGHGKAAAEEHVREGPGF